MSEVELKTKELVLMSLFMGIGFVLHAIIPGFFFGMKPDMFLVMMFVGILRFPSIKNVMLLGITTGILTALTTTFPGGQVPNIIDKGLTSLLFFVLLLLLKKHVDHIVVVLGLTFIGTLISGSIFLFSALMIAGLPVGFVTLFMTVVLPTAGINTVAMGFIYTVVMQVEKRIHHAD